MARRGSNAVDGTRLRLIAERKKLTGTTIAMSPRRCSEENSASSLARVWQQMNFTPRVEEWTLDGLNAGIFFESFPSSLGASIWKLLLVQRVIYSLDFDRNELKFLTGKYLSKSCYSILIDADWTWLLVHQKLWNTLRILLWLERKWKKQDGKEKHCQESEWNCQGRPNN